ncbi:MAG TPA: hypothetical protein VMZ27_07660, partial [Candidatus Saccharimonadales bacterium]|nr:hypothetical protein [Candidatus Saccharimonadales bacterium]
MHRPAQIWIVFGAALVVLLAAMGWVSWTAVRFERAQAEAQSKADFEEKVRLALWRMDSTLSPFLVQESSRPYFTYNSFYVAERAYNRMFAELKAGDVLVPSPLLTETSTNVLLHFQAGPDGVLTSPQVPVGNRRDLAQGRYLSPTALKTASERLASLQKLVSPQALQTACVITLPAENPGNYAANGAQPDFQIPNMPVAQQQMLRNSAELRARNQSLQQAAAWNGQKGDLSQTLPGPNITEGIVRPIWFGDALVLARRVSAEGKNYIQGCWLDWPGIQGWLLASVHDLLPHASLQPIRDKASDPQVRLLASVPVKLVPGPVPMVQRSGISPIWFALVIAWVCMFLASLAVAVLLHGAISLSE